MDECGEKSHFMKTAKSYPQDRGLFFSCTQSYPQPVDKCINCFCLLKFSLLYHNKPKIGISKFNKFKTVDFAGKPFSLFIFWIE